MGAAASRRARALLAAAVIVPVLAACNPLAATPLADAPGTGSGAQGISATDAAPPPPAPAPVPVAPAPVPVAPAPPAPVESPAATPVPEPAPVLPAAAPVTDPSGNPLAGDTLYGPNPGAAEAAARLQGSRPADAALLARMAAVPTATWLGSWIGDVTTAVRQRVAEAPAAGAVPVFVTYNVPGLDCGGHSSSGGVQSAAAYDAWVRAVAAGIGDAEAVVVVEPADQFALLCGDAAARFRMLQSAVQVLEANPGTHTYLDAGTRLDRRRDDGPAAALRRARQRPASPSTSPTTTPPRPTSPTATAQHGLVGTATQAIRRRHQPQRQRLEGRVVQPGRARARRPRPPGPAAARRCCCGSSPRRVRRSLQRRSGGRAVLGRTTRWAWPGG